MDEKILPAFEGNKNCIVFSSNERFAPVTAVAVKTLLKNGSKDNKYDILLLETEIKSETKNRLIEMVSEFENASLRIIDVKHYAGRRRFYTKNREELSREAYYRLFIPYILGDEYEKALYLDADMIFYKDVNELFDIELGDHLIAAVRDYWGTCNCYMPWDERRSYRESIGLKEIDEYVISATIVFNLDVFRRSYDLDDVLKFASERHWMQHDQDIINVLCKGKIFHLSPSWGYVTDFGNNHYLPQYLQKELVEAEQNINVFHFAANRKPWNNQYTEDHMNFWREAARTPFFVDILLLIKTSERLNYVIYFLKSDPAVSDLDWTIDEISAHDADKDHPEGRYFKGIYLGKYGGGHARYRVIRIEKGILHLEGMLGFFGVDTDCEVKVRFLINDELYPVSKQLDENEVDIKTGAIRYRGVSFVFEIPVSELKEKYKRGFSIVPDCLVNGKEVKKDTLGFEPYSPIVRDLKYSYAPLGDYVVYTDRKKLVFKNNNLLRRFLYERRLILLNFFVPRKPYLRAIFIRKAIHIGQLFKRRPIWLITDRVMKADDNGEAFFIYLNSRKDKDKIDTYFVIDKESEDYKRLSGIGKVVSPGSVKHKLLLTRADCVVSSQTDKVFRYPFLWNGRLYRDMLANVKFVFLQHGVLEKDASRWLKRRNQEIRGMVTSAARERDSILAGDYDYSPDEIWLTGLTRFDRLENAAEKIVTIAPTWRKYLCSGQDKKTGSWNLNPGFEKSEYVCFYRDLANDKRLNEALKQNGFTLKFKIHPSLRGHEDAFCFENKDIWWNDSVSYRDIFKKSSLFITDYSSAISDFVYMRKPIMYCQFDRDTFYSEGHIVDKGDFSYEDEGFGEVTYDIDSTVSLIIDYMENGCVMKDKYKKRADDYYEYNDRNNCERVYEKVLALVEER